ncbi:MAG: DUF1062 domain-containing protein [Proteobacteria bacterium]|nr:DUF1062 domain-containing protein [Pseudomonadota bacterium]
MTAQHVESQSESQWRIIPLYTPRVWRHCRRCNSQQPFASSDRFRVNANQRRLDVWLIYRCTACDSTWNREIAARVTPGDIGAACHARFQDNDRDEAWRWAFDLSSLTARGIRVAGEVAVRVERTGNALQCTECPGHCHRGSLCPAADSCPRPGRIRLILQYPCNVRLDKLLAREFGASRSHIARLIARGDLRILGGPPRPLRKPVRDGQILVLGKEA